MKVITKRLHKQIRWKGKVSWFWLQIKHRITINTYYEKIKNGAC